MSIAALAELLCIDLETMAKLSLLGDEAAQILRDDPELRQRIIALNNAMLFYPKPKGKPS